MWRLNTSVFIWAFEDIFTSKLLLQFSFRSKRKLSHLGRLFFITWNLFSLTSSLTPPWKVIRGPEKIKRLSIAFIFFFSRLLEPCDNSTSRKRNKHTHSRLQTVFTELRRECFELIVCFIQLPPTPQKFRFNVTEKWHEVPYFQFNFSLAFHFLLKIYTILPENNSTINCQSTWLTLSVIWAEQAEQFFFYFPSLTHLIVYLQL